MDFKHKIIQWNCRGLSLNYNEVSLLIFEYNPSVFVFKRHFLYQMITSHNEVSIYITMFKLIVCGPFVVPQYL